MIDLEAKFEPSLLNTAIYLLGLSQQVSTFAINYQGRPFREGIRENPALYWGLVGAAAVAISGATDFMPELNRWLQIVEMESHVSTLSFRRRDRIFIYTFTVQSQVDRDDGPRLRRLLVHRERLQVFVRRLRTKSIDHQGPRT